MRIDEVILSPKENPFSILDKEELYDKERIKQEAENLRVLLSDVNPGDRVGIIIDNSVEYIISLMAVSSLQATAVLIEPNTPVQAMLDYLEAAKVSFVITTEKINTRLPKKFIGGKSLGDTPYIQISKSYGDKLEDVETDEAFILFSSGTTGVAKGIILTHAAVIQNISSIIAYMHPTPKDTFYITRTMVYVSSLIGEVLVALLAGSKLVISNPKNSPRTTLSLIEKHKVTIIGVNPTILNLLIKASYLGTIDLSCVRSVYVSGSVAKKEILMEAQKVFNTAGVFNVYGLTEAGFRVSAQREDGFNEYGSVGVPIDGVQIKISNDQGLECAPLQSGEVYVKTPSVMKGYLNNSTLTKEKIVDGWLKTNDEGYVDEQGQLFVLGRKDDMINRDGFNIDPLHIENVINKYEGVKECIVFATSDEKVEQKVICAYVRSDSHSGELNAKVINQFCQSYLKQIEIPSIAIEWDYIPRTHTGKVSRYLAKERYLKERL